MKKEIKELKEQAIQLLSRIEELEAEEIDYSILNNEDVFYIECKGQGKFKYLFKGSNFWDKEVKGYDFDSKCMFTNVICNKKDVAELRKATKEEKLYYKHYPRTIDVWIEVYKEYGAYICTRLLNGDEKEELIKDENTIKIQKVTITLD